MNNQHQLDEARFLTRIVVDSRDRNLTAWPSAAEFEIDVLNSINDASAIELVEALVPLAAGVTENVAVLRVKDLKITNAVAPYPATAGMANPIFDDATAVLPLKPTVFGATGEERQLAHWCKSEKRWCYKFDNCTARVIRMRFRLELRDPTAPTGIALYPNAAGPDPWLNSLAPEHNVLYTFDIYSCNT